MQLILQKNKYLITFSTILLQQRTENVQNIYTMTWYISHYKHKMGISWWQIVTEQLSCYAGCCLQETLGSFVECPCTSWKTASCLLFTLLSLFSVLLRHVVNSILSFHQDLHGRSVFILLSPFFSPSPSSLHSVWHTTPMKMIEDNRLRRLDSVVHKTRWFLARTASGMHVAVIWSVMPHMW